MKKLYLLLFLGLSACSAPQADKEKELLEKELELTKKELALKEKELEVQAKADSIAKTKITINTQIEESPKVQKTKELVFQLSDFQKSPKKYINFEGKKYNINIDIERKEGVEPPAPMISTVFFVERGLVEKPKYLPVLRVDLSIDILISKDLNKDGREELIFIQSTGNGTMRYLQIYALSDPSTSGNRIWYPIGSYMRWAFSEYEDKFYWIEEKQQLEIWSQEPGSQEEPSKPRLIDWKMM